MTGPASSGDDGGSAKACPNDDALAAYLDGALDRSATAAVERHLSVCRGCRLVVHPDAAPDRGRASADLLRSALAPQLRSRRDWAAGQYVGRYRIEQRLGAGAMGTVYRARDPALDRLVALKCLHLSASADLEAGRQRLWAEAKALARIDDTSIVEVFDVGEYDGAFFLVMELVDGLPVRRWAERASPTAIIAAMRVVATALHAVHRLGLVHGDVKPDNLMMDRRGRVRLLDFGLARAIALERATSAGDEPGAPPPGGPGTPAYMAPELLEGAAPTPATDQFAWSVTLFELLCERRPFRGQTRQELLVSARHGPIEWPETRLPRNVAAVVERGLSADPTTRWLEMKDAADSLRPRRRRRQLLFATIGAVASIAAAVALVAPGDPPTMDETVATEELTVALWAQDVLDSELAEVAALRRAGRDRQAHQRAREIAARASAIGLRRQYARAAFEVGSAIAWSPDDPNPRTDWLLEAFGAASEVADDVTAADAALSLVELHKKLGDYDGALRWAREAQIRAERTANAPQRAMLDVSLAGVYEKQGQLATSLEHARRGLQQWTTFDEPYLEETGKARIAVGGVLAQMSAYDEAITVLRAAIRDLSATRGSHQGYLAQAHNALGAAMHLGGDVTSAIEHLRASLSILEGLDGADRVLGQLESNLGSVLLDAGRVDEGIVHIRRGLNTVTRIYGPTDPRLSSGFTGLGRGLSMQGNHDLAIATLWHAAELAKDHGGEHDRSYIAALGNIAIVRAVQGDRAKAVALLERVVALATESQGATADQTLRAIETLDCLRAHRGPVGWDDGIGAP